MAEFFDILRTNFAGPGNLNDQLILFGLMFTRLLIIVTLLPFLGGPSAPSSAKIAISLALACLFWPHVYARAGVVPEATLLIIMLLLKEALVGLIIAFISVQIFYAASIAGQLIDIFRGASMIQVMVPQLKQQASPFASMLFQLLVVLFLTAGYHGLFFEALADSFIALPVTSWPAFSFGAEAFAGEIITCFAESFLIGFKLAVPVAIVVLMINVAFGLMNRVAPQINAFFMSMPALTLGGMMIFFAAFSTTIEQFSLMTKIMLKNLAAAIRLM